MLNRAEVVVTEVEGFKIIHRPGTELMEEHLCVNGHLAPRYVGGSCVVCCKLNALKALGADEGRLVYSQQRSNIEKSLYCENVTNERFLQYKFDDYQKALKKHIDIGGHLITSLDGGYIVTTNWKFVRRMKGKRWIDMCERLQCWDEVSINENRIK